MTEPGFTILLLAFNLLFLNKSSHLTKKIMHTLIADITGKIKIGTTIFIVKKPMHSSLNKKLNPANTKVHSQPITFFLNSKSNNMSTIIMDKYNKIPDKY